MVESEFRVTYGGFTGHITTYTWIPEDEILQEARDQAEELASYTIEFVRGPLQGKKFTGNFVATPLEIVGEDGVSGEDREHDVAHELNVVYYVTDQHKENGNG